ncbi:MAG: hydrolase 2, exosortase A system-associated [Gammaproteobacteria bacterium]|uniref:hydrolase 2, exosortase A system-associated n=1 Tax=Rhodoferax sp. TaxID=50421 RepID=UPI0017C56C21|nr:hydrolase 2, exosortase A system-associated [Rhodoferax sp.]MBU3897516.1 hydrolase 2, exosortase A system-associated [Gammaproteobacteria bacterium]MBA3058024.1 hydrolase 2, exosortase A system-associated [Rhodoferax sp.]MBU3998813.1 hydrolase 2, exosortase A system-associated [Gammaproteobacteria bacterium]MBU4018862.1 hydrolase 2, exosortase A system-associated [Gammaproteobacteria bacterium]MBU4079817.1 hydrolase 2, exosortase A system-associated [Gammaproteobacteria bacterium]
MPASAECFFLPAGATAANAADQRFCVFYAAQGPTARALVLYIHPFSEEMNKARRMAALQARALAQAGCAVLQIDLLGCGDSSGDFGDATWQSWVNDVVRGSRWLHQRHHAPGPQGRNPPLWLWGLRAGCLLAVEAASQMSEPCHLLFWQPPPAGRPLLQQFLRLKAAADLQSNQAKNVMAGLRQQLNEGSPVEVAGYQLAPELARGLEQSVLLPGPATKPGRLEWFEMSTRTNAVLSPASNEALTQWQQRGFEVRSRLINGPAFWQSAEIEDVPALITATTAAVAFGSTQGVSSTFHCAAGAEVLAA